MSMNFKDIYLSNAFSLQMLGDDYAYNVKVSSLDVSSVQFLLARGFTSIIGHSDTAAVVSDILETSVECNRVSVTLSPSDGLIVAQVMGGRLPEGANTLPEGFKIEFKLVQVSLPIPY